MALALEAQRNVWRKVEQFLDSHDNGSVTPQARQAIEAFKLAFITQKSNSALLQFVPFSAADITTNLGYSPLDVPAKVYALYIKNPGNSTGTDSYITLHNAANNASVPFITGLIQVSDDEFVYLNPRGVDFTTDVTVSGATTAGGATESAAADAGDGFVLVGAA
jgi:hypothetical protein